MKATRRIQTEVAARLGVSEKTLMRRWPPAIPWVRIGNLYRLSQERADQAGRAMGLLPPAPPPPQPLAKWWRTLMLNAKRRAAKAGVPFTLTEDDMRSLIARAGNCCELTGIRFSDRRAGDRQGAWRPYAASIDRIRPVEGYTPDNCRLVCCAVNIALGAWGMDVLLPIARALVAKHGDADE